eukprot:2725339-Pyramimonas_sp.AAC.1
MGRGLHADPATRAFFGAPYRRKVTTMRGAAAGRGADQGRVAGQVASGSHGGPKAAIMMRLWLAIGP